MRVHLPNSAFLGNIDPFLRSLDGSDDTFLEITANESWISIHPVVLCMIAALGSKIGSESIRPIRLKAISKHYLERMALFRMIGLPSGMDIKEHEPAGRFIPLTVIKTSDELTAFITDMVPLLHLEPDQSRPIKYTISELVRNVLEHSGSEEGAIVCAQYYKKSNTIRIGIVDTGVGIRKTISESHLAHTDLEAIHLALTPGITGTTRRERGTETNAGAGLFFIKSLATVNRDFFMVYSGNSMYKLLRSNPGKKGIKLSADPMGDRHSSGEDFPLWQGTVIGIDLSLDTTSEFTTMLDMIRKTYINTIKERKKDRYRRPRFI
jgi:anti-sigma regulatory factor (Ser/Thr protein kinase)